MTNSNDSRSLTTINDLPDDMLCEVFDRLSVNEVLAIRTVNKDFNRSAQQWLKTVDNVFIFKLEFCLGKTFGKSITSFNVPNHFSMFKVLKSEQLFSSFEKMITVCTGIQNVGTLLSQTHLQLTDLFDRCSNMRQFFILLGLPSQLADDDWRRLIRFIENKQQQQHFDVHLDVHDLWPSTNDNQTNQQLLKQLFESTSQRIKTFDFLFQIEDNYSLNSFDTFKTIAYLNRESRVELFCIKLPKLIDEEVRDLISRRVDILKINLDDFQALSLNRYFKLSSLDIHGHVKSHDPKSSSSAIPKIKFDRLKQLAISEFQSRLLILNFFAAVRRFDQLEKLHLNSRRIYSLIKDDRLTGMLAKMPNITKLSIRWSDFLQAEIPAFERLFQLLLLSSSQSLLTPHRLRTVAIAVFIYRLSADEFDRLIISLADFANQMSEIKLLAEFHYIDDQVSFQNRVEVLPTNVQVKWCLKNSKHVKFYLNSLKERPWLIKKLE